MSKKIHKTGAMRQFFSDNNSLLKQSLVKPRILSKTFFMDLLLYILIFLCLTAYFWYFAYINGMANMPADSQDYEILVAMFAAIQPYGTAFIWIFFLIIGFITVSWFFFRGKIFEVLSGQRLRLRHILILDSIKVCLFILLLLVLSSIALFATTWYSRIIVIIAFWLVTYFNMTYSTSYARTLRFWASVRNIFRYNLFRLSIVPYMISYLTILVAMAAVWVIVRTFFKNSVLAQIITLLLLIAIINWARYYLFLVTRHILEEKKLIRPTKAK